ncbi:MAG: MMPL family transporter [Acidobacteriota bacterium]
MLPHRFSLALVRLAARRPHAVLLSAAAAAVVALVLALGVRIDTDLLSLIPADNPAVDDFRVTVERFGSTDLFLAAVVVEDGQLEPALAYADALAGALRASERIDWVEYRLQDLSEALAPMLRWAPLFMTETELESFLDRLRPEALDLRAETLSRQLRTPAQMALEPLLTRDPLGMLEAVQGSFATGQLDGRFDDETGYLIDPEQRFVLLLIKPIRPAADVPFARELMGSMPDVESTATSAWHDAGFDGEAPAVRYAGGYPIAVGDTTLIVQDMVIGAVSALVGVGLLFAFAFRRKTALVIAMTPLAAGLLFTFAFTAISLGRLNAATSAFAALLIGLGIDFVIVLYGRYVEERSEGRTHQEALDSIGSSTAVGVLLGAVTTGATFFAFLISDFAGLAELGLITGAGILILVVTVFLLLPALLTVLDLRRPEKKHHLRAFGIDKLSALALKYPRWMLAATAVITIVLGSLAPGVRYDDNVVKVRASDNPGAETQREIMDAFGIRFTPLMIRIDGADEPEAIARARALWPKLDELVDNGVLARIEGVAHLLPSAEQQQAALTRLAAFDRDGATVRDAFATSLRSAGLNPNGFAEGLDTVAAALDHDRPFSVEAVRGTTVGHALDRYIAGGTDADGADVFSTVLYAYPPADLAQGAIPQPLSELIEASEGTVLTGPAMISRALKDVVWRDATLAALIGTIIVLILLAIDFGGLKEGLLALLPLLVGTVWMLGLMDIFDLDVNFMNIFVFTMVIGIGVDYGIHLLHRWHETGGDDPTSDHPSPGDPEAIRGTSGAITIAALTTMVGFGSLVLSHVPGLRSMGMVAILGAGATALVSMTVLPALLAVLAPRRR